MRHTRHVVCIAEASNVDIDGGASFVCFWVMDEKGFELVCQSYDTVGPIVECWSIQNLCDAMYGCHVGKGTFE